jgi:hypothetical protein
MLGEATLDVSGTFAGEAIRLPIQIAALQSTTKNQKPLRVTLNKLCQPLAFLALGAIPAA